MTYFLVETGGLQVEMGPTIGDNTACKSTLIWMSLQWWIQNFFLEGTPSWPTLQGGGANLKLGDFC